MTATDAGTSEPSPQPLADSDPRQLGRYALLGRLGQGGMGTVYLGRSESGQAVAVKVIRADLAEEDEFRALFRREADTARRVARFCTAEVLDVDISGAQPYIVTEYVPGSTLERSVRANGPMGSADLERLAVSVAAALTAIHGAGMVHRDLKPSNVLLSPLGPRVIDFGIARAYDATTMLSRTRAGSGPGTPAFMSPEQAQGGEVGPAADIFAWGGVVAFATTGRKPFGEGNPMALLYRVVHEPPDLGALGGPLRSVVELAMSKNPADRPNAHDLFLLLLGSNPGSFSEADATRLAERPSVPAPTPVPTPAGSGRSGYETAVIPTPSWPSASPSLEKTPSLGQTPPPEQTPPPRGGPTDPWTPPPGRSSMEQATTQLGGTQSTAGSGSGGEHPGNGGGAGPGRWRRHRGALLAGAGAALVAIVALVAVLASTGGGGPTPAPTPTTPPVDHAAVSARIAAISQQLAVGSPALARQLSLAAYRVAATPQADAALLRSYGVGPIALTAGHTDTVWAGVISPDGRLLATASEDKTTRLWDLSDRAHPVQVASLSHTGKVYWVAFSPDGRTLADGGADGKLRLWDVTSPANPTALATFSPSPSPSGMIYGLAFSPDGRTIAVADSDHTGRLVDVSDPRNPRLTATLSGHTDNLQTVAFSPDGRLLATGSADKTARLWDITTPGDPVVVATLSGHADTVFGVAFSPDGRTLATGSADKTVKLWDVSTPRAPVLLSTLTRHTGDVTSVAFSPIGHLLVSVGDDKTVRFWDTTDARNPAALTTQTGYPDFLDSVAFSRDGSTVAVTGSPKTFGMIDTDPAAIATRACAAPANGISAQTWQQYIPELPYQATCP